MPPQFDANPLTTLASLIPDADAELDLRGLRAEQAVAEVERLLEAGPERGARVFRVRFDPPDRAGAETLFLPVGRHLLAARRAGRLARCLPLPTGEGYVIELPGPA